MQWKSYSVTFYFLDILFNLYRETKNLFLGENILLSSHLVIHCGKSCAVDLAHNRHPHFNSNNTFIMTSSIGVSYKSTYNINISIIIWSCLIFYRDNILWYILLHYHEVDIVISMTTIILVKYLSQKKLLVYAGPCCRNELLIIKIL